MMNMLIESTATVVEILTAAGGVVQCRVWNGVTERGTKCLVFVPRIAALEGDHRELREALLDVTEITHVEVTQ